MKKLRISPSLSLPLDFVTSTQAILAKKGSGKSYTASVQAEELLEAGQQIVVVDPTGAWWGLRSSSDGKSSGFPIAVLGGEHGDVPLEATAGEVIADAIAADHFSAVLDLSLFRKAEANRFMGVFLETLYRKNREALHIFIDEADTVAPQKPFGEEARTLGATEDIVRRGRIRGIGCTLITQRPQVLNKNVLSQVDMLTALRMNHPKDIGAIKEWVAVHGDEAQAKQMISDLPALPIGEAWIWAPATDLFDRVKIRLRKTFDSGRTPKAGERAVAPRVLAAVDIARLGKTIAATVERAKDSDPKALRARVAELEKRLAAKSPATREVKVAAIDAKTLSRVEKLAERLTKDTNALDAARDRLAQAQQAVLAEVGNMLTLARRQTAPTAAAMPPDLANETRRLHVQRMPKIGAAPTPARTAPLHERVAKMPGGDRPAPAQQRILDTLALLERLGIEPSREVLAAWYGSHPNSKGLVNNVGALRSAGLVDGVSLTAQGRAAANWIEPPTQAEARDRILKPLSPSKRRILEVLINMHPAGVSREVLAAELGKHPNSKGLVNDIGALRSRQIVSAGWPLTAKSVLFLGGGS